MTECMCRGCYAGSGASLHYIPKDPETRQKWIEFIYRNRPAPRLKNLDRIRICSAHFTEECFTNYRQKMMGFGKRLILKPNAVPTIEVQLEFTTPSRTRQEKREETTAEMRLCPLCQRRQKDSEALSFHLTKKHSVHPACLDNLLITAPYANHSCGVSELTTQNINTSTEDTKFPLMQLQQDDSQEYESHGESGVGNGASSYSDPEATVKEEKSNAKNNASHPYKCYSCLEFFTHKSALSVHYNSATHIQKIRTGAGNDSDSVTPVMAYPYVSNKPYQCDVCHVSYFYSFGLESHLKSVLHQSRTRKAGNTAANSKTNTNIVQTVLPLLTLAPNSVPHTIVPSVFPSPGTSSTQLLPQTQMLMPLIMNGTPDSSQQMVQQAVPVLGICSAQQVQGLSSSDSQSQSAASGETKSSVDEVRVKFEIKKEPCDLEASEMLPRTADAITQVDLKQENNSMWNEIEDRIECGDQRPSVGINSKRQRSDVTKSTPPKCNSSHTHLASKLSSTKLLPSSTSESPALTEFQSQVLWAFLESRNEADSEIPPREDCEALGREVGLTEDEVQKWLMDRRHTKDGHRVDVQTRYERQESTEDDEDALMIDESGGTVLRSSTDFLSDEEDTNDEQTIVDKKRKRGMD